MTPSDIPWGYSRTDRKSAAATQNTEDFRLAATLDIARHFTCLLRESDFIAAEGKYRSDDVVRVEPFDEPAWLCCGEEAVRKRDERWREGHIVHTCLIEGPYLNGEQFLVRLRMEVTSKATGNRRLIDKICLYAVAHGKIVAETHYYRKD
jgi:hypothetical protein